MPTPVQLPPDDIRDGVFFDEWGRPVEPERVEQYKAERLAALEYAARVAGERAAEAARNRALKYTGYALEEFFSEMRVNAARVREGEETTDPPAQVDR